MLKLRVHAFGTTGPEAKRYELWPEEKSFVIFYPRWVNARLEKRTYRFDYEWHFAAKPGNEAVVEGTPNE